jgi:polygalacturonase
MALVHIGGILHISTSLRRSREVPKLPSSQIDPEGRLVQFLWSNNIRILGVTLQHSPFWTLHIYSSSNVMIDSIKVYNRPGSPNTDGIDVDSSVNVTVSKCHIESGDDHISIKAGLRFDEKFTDFPPTRNVLIENCFFGLGARFPFFSESAGGGIAIGSEVTGSVSDVVVRRNTMVGGYNFVRLKASAGRGGSVSNVTFEDNHLDGVVIGVYVNLHYKHPTPGPFVLYKDINILKTSGVAGKAADLSVDFDWQLEDLLVVDWDVVSPIGWKCHNATFSRCK